MSKSDISHRGFNQVELPMDGRRAFTIVELLVVIAIIVVLISMLLPTLVKAINQSHYVSWQAYRRGLETDPTLVAHWQLWNDEHTSTLTNSAVLEDNSGMSSHLADGAIQRYPNAWPSVPISGSYLDTSWTKGRWGLKPALKLQGPGNNVWVSFPVYHDKLGSILGKTQQVTIAIWVAPGILPASNQPLINWQTKSGAIAYRIHLPWASDGKAYWYAGSDPLYDGLSYSVSNVRTQWQLWVFTKDATGTPGVQGSMKIYANGVLVSSVACNYPLSTNTDGNPISSTDQKGLCIGYLSGGGWTNSVFDEVAIWDRVLTPGEIEGMYKSGQY